MARHGTADLPLHGGSAPRWLFDRMVDLGGAIAELIIQEHGRQAFLHRLSDPYWFQAFGCVLGFDWHSSGVTTTTMGALKEALDPTETGLVVVGGKGSTSRQTPTEITDTDLDISTGTRSSLIEASKLSALVDNACVQDSYQLYHHTMVISEDGDWCVVQQGMNDSYARRYHWVSDDVSTFVIDPQSAICSQHTAPSVLDLSANTSTTVQDISVDLVQDNPVHLKEFLRPHSQSSLSAFTDTASPTRSPAGRKRGDRETPDLHMPARHALRRSDLTERAIDQLDRAYEQQPTDYEELISIEGIGPKSLRALALIAELVYDAEASRDDPAKYAYAHGGKDGTPVPVDRQRYDTSIKEVRRALEGADVDTDTKQSALTRLHELTDTTDHTTNANDKPSSTRG